MRFLFLIAINKFKKIKLIEILDKKIKMTVEYLVDCDSQKCIANQKTDWSAKSSGGFVEQTQITQSVMV